MDQNGLCSGDAINKASENIQVLQDREKGETVEKVEKTETVTQQPHLHENIQKIEQQQDKQESKENGREDAEEVKFEEIAVEEEEEQLLEENLQKAQQYKNAGGQFFKNGNEINAIQQYQKAMQYTADPNFRATLCSNISICLIKDENFHQAKRFCQKALKYNENLRKPRTNLARCYENEQKFEEALEEYKKLEKDVPANEGAFIRQKIMSTQKKVDEINEKRKTQVIDGLKNIGNSVLGYFGMSLDNFKLEQGPGGGYNISFKQ